MKLSSAVAHAALAVVSLVCPRTAPGQAQPLPPLDEFHVRVFRPIDGLPLSDVRSLAQTPDGLLLLATGRGLIGYDGHEFAPIPMPGFQSDRLEYLLPDGLGRVWVLSLTSDVGYLEEGRVVRLDSLPSPLDGIRLGPDGSVWLTGGRNIVRVHGAPPQVTRHALAERVDPPLARVRAYFEIPRGDPIITADWKGAPGVFRVVGGLETSRPTLESRPLDGAAVARHDTTGLWYVSRSEVVRFHADSVTALEDSSSEYAGYRHPNGLFKKRLVASDGSVWTEFVEDDWNGDSFVVRDLGGVRTAVDLRRHLSFRSIQAVLEDHEGSVWFATDRGLVQMTPRPVLQLTADHGLAEEFTAPIRQTMDGSLWVGTWGAGLHRFADGRLAARVTTADGLVDNRIRALHEDPDGDLWVATGAGVAMLRADRVAARYPMGDRARAFARTADGTLWIGTDLRLLALVDGELREHRADLFRNRRIWTLHATPEGLWIGSEDGLFRLTPDSIESFDQRRGLTSSFVPIIHEDGSGTLWFSSYAHGLHRFRDGRFTAVTTAEGLHHNGIWSMLEDGHGGVWMSSDGGLARVELRRLHEVADAVERDVAEAARPRLRPLVFTEAEGMPSRESNRAQPGAWRLTDGRLVFNNVAGLAIVDPETALRAPPPPRTRITRVEADGTVVDLSRDGVGRVPGGTRHVGFEYAALSYVAPLQNRHRYRLDGFDDEWIEGGTRRRTQYTGLRPGRYEFIVQSAGKQGEWSEVASTYAFVVQPLFWQTWWFRLALFGLAAGLVVAAYRYRIRHLLEVQRVRLQIASDLHDDVGSNLGSIVLLSQMLASAEGFEGMERRQLERIRAAAEETVAGLRDIIWLVDPRHTDLSDLVLRMQSVASNLLNGNEISFEGPASLDHHAVDMTWMHNVFLVYKEALHNAARHAAGSRVDIAVSVEGGRLRLAVRDDGPGFDAGVDGRGYGLRTMKRRATDIGGTLGVESEIGAGTTVRLEVPLP